MSHEMKDAELRLMISELVDESDAFAEQLLNLSNLEPLHHSKRRELAYVACSLANEHWYAIRQLLRSALLPSALVLHRTQFETIVRSIWLTYAATDTDISKLSADLDLDAEQAAKNVAQTQVMIDAIGKAGPKEAHAAITRFKDYSWKALNSYTHSGIHPLNRHAQGYPVTLLHNVLRNVNGLGVLTAMQSVVVADAQPLQQNVLELASKYSRIMPPTI